MRLTMHKETQDQLEWSISFDRLLSSDERGMYVRVQSREMGQMFPRQRSTSCKQSWSQSIIVMSSAAFRCGRKLSSLDCRPGDLSRQEPYAFCGTLFVATASFPISYLSSILTIQISNFTTLTRILHQPLTFTISPTRTSISSS